MENVVAANVVGIIEVGIGAVLLLMARRQWALTEEEFELLLCGIVMAWLAPWDWPFSYYFYLCLTGREALVLLNMAKSTLHFAKQGKKANPILRTCFECDEREVLMVFWIVVVYLWVRISVMKSQNFSWGLNNSSTFLT